MTEQNEQKTEDQAKDIPTIQKVIAIIWPSFLVAGVSTGLMFAYIDPTQFLFGTQYAQISRLGIYTITFFLFWLIGAASSILTCYFRKYCHDCETDQD